MGHVVTLIGEATRVAVNTDSHNGKVKWASCQGIRRSFSQHWAGKIMLPDLMVLMRHESIDTTLRYYVGRNAEATAEMLWQAHKPAMESNTLGNTHPEWPETTIRAGDLNILGRMTSKVGPEGTEHPQESTGKTAVSQTGGAKSGEVGAQNDPVMAWLDACPVTMDESKRWAILDILGT